jgi:cytochrome b involved in lipid metabolism
MSEQFTAAQVAEHKDVDKGLYIIIDSNVYKMDTFVDEHPGGSKILKRVGGKDASKQFWKVCTILCVRALGQDSCVAGNSGNGNSP